MRPKSDRLEAQFGRRYIEEDDRVFLSDASDTPVAQNGFHDANSGVFDLRLPEDHGAGAHEDPQAFDDGMEIENLMLEAAEEMEAAAGSDRVDYANMRELSHVPTPRSQRSQEEQPRQRRVVRDRQELLQVLADVAPLDDHARQPFHVPPTVFKLSWKEQYRLLPDLRDRFRDIGLFLPRSSKKGPTFNYLVGVLCGRYQPFRMKRVPDFVAAIKRYQKSEILNELRRGATLPLGFGLVDSPHRVELLKMLYLLNPNSYILVPPRQAVARLALDAMGLVIPVSLTRFVRFNEMRLEDLERQARLGTLEEEFKRRKAMQRVVAKLTRCFEVIGNELRYARRIINQNALMGLKEVTETFEQLDALVGFK